MPAEQLLYHQPYLQRMEPEGVTILYQTRALAHSWVEYGTDTLSLATSRQLAGGQEVVHDVEHRVRLEQLTPGATYYYRVCVQEIVNSEAYSKTFGDTYRTPFFRFQLPTAQIKDFTALIFNDLHLVPEVMQAMSRLAARPAEGPFRCVAQCAHSSVGLLCQRGVGQSLSRGGGRRSLVERGNDAGVAETGQVAHPSGTQCRG